MKPLADMSRFLEQSAFQLVFVRSIQLLDVPTIEDLRETTLLTEVDIAYLDKSSNHLPPIDYVPSGSVLVIEALLETLQEIFDEDEERMRFLVFARHLSLDFAEDKSFSKVVAFRFGITDGMAHGVAETMSAFALTRSGVLSVDSRLFQHLKHPSTNHIFREIFLRRNDVPE